MKSLRGKIALVAGATGEPAEVSLLSWEQLVQRFMSQDEPQEQNVPNTTDLKRLKIQQSLSLRQADEASLYR